MKIEESFEQIEDILKVLENKDTPLEDAFKEYSKGIKLVSECNEALDKVEKEIIVLQANEDNS